ncbi:TPA: hypothetical protein JS297_004687 [Escherichia coli]|nr:hypothetical protein [Escherichia coli]
MKKVMFFTSLFLITTSAIAGGGKKQDSWQPSVSPINCVQGDSQGWRLSNAPACREVFEKRYAQGVQYSGVIKWPDGTTGDFVAPLYYEGQSRVPYPRKNGMIGAPGKVSAHWIKY